MRVTNAQQRMQSHSVALRNQHRPQTGDLHSWRTVRAASNVPPVTECVSDGSQLLRAHPPMHLPASHDAVCQQASPTASDGSKYEGCCVHTWVQLYRKVDLHTTHANTRQHTTPASFRV